MNLTNKYTNAFSEVYEILQYLDQEEYKKIPSNLINAIKFNRNINYVYKIVPEKKLKEQKMLPETKAILFNIFRDYLSTEKQRTKIKKWQAEDLKKMEEAKQLKYDIDVFKNRDIENATNLPTEVVQLVEVKQQNIWQKIINRIKKIFIRD